MEAYKIWATLDIKGDAHKKMEQFAALIKKTTAELSKLTKILSTFEAKYAGVAASLRVINPELRSFNAGIIDSARRMNSASASADRLSRSLRSVNAQAGGGGGRGHSGNNKFLAGAAGALGLYNPSMMGGVAVGYTAAHGFHQNTEYQRSILQLKAQGFTESQINEANTIATKVRPGISSLGMLHALVDAQMATRNFDQAKILAPILAQGAAAAQVSYGGMSHGQQQNLVRVAELAGGSKTEEQAKWLTVALQMMATSGGTLMPSEQRTFWRQAGGAMKNLTPLGYLSLEPILQEYGGAKTGTALTTGLRAFINPQMAHFARYQTESLQKFGLWDSKTNRMKQEYIHMLQTDPAQFSKAWVGQLAKHGVTSDSGILTETMADFPRTFGTALALMIKNSEKIDNSRTLALHAMGGKELFEESQKTQDGALYRLSKAFDTFSLAINKASSSRIIGFLNMISWIFEHLAANAPSSSGAPGATSIKGSGIGSLFSHFKTDLAASSKSAKNDSVGHVYLDSHKVGKVVFGEGSSAIQTYVQHGTTSVNSYSSPFSSALNSQGSQGI